MTIKGPISDDRKLDVRRYKGMKDSELPYMMKYVEEQVVSSMEEDMGMPVRASRDEYKVGGGFLVREVRLLSLSSGA